MIISKPILSVDLLVYTDKYEKEWHDCFLQKVGEFAFHTTEGYALLFITENHFITLGYGGLNIYDLSYEFPEDKYELWGLGDDEWISEEETIFKGQRVISISQEENHKLIKFDSFEMKLYEYDEREEFIDRQEYFKRGWINKMAVGNHLLTRKCECGGNGELLVDERNDFAVRCQNCHKSTCFDMILIDQINSWNNGDTPIVIDELN